MAGVKSAGREYVDRAKAVGWKCRPAKGGGWNITADNGTVITVHSTPSDRNTIDIWERQFRQAGLGVAEKTLERQRHVEAQVRLEREKVQAEKTAERRKTEAEALLRAAGAVKVTAELLLKEHAAPTTYSRIIVTPDMARDLLTANTHNRKIKKNNYADICTAMMRGEWKYTGDPYRFDTAGVLLDGQHRLMAQVATDTVAVVDVICGLPPEVFYVVDQGARRTAADSLGLVGEASLNLTVAVCKLVMLYRSRPDHSNFMRGMRWSIQSVMDFMDDPIQAETLRMSVRWGDSLATHVQANRTGAGAFAFLAWEAMGEFHPLLDPFMDNVRYGANIDRDDPAMLLRNAFANIAAGRRDDKKAPAQLALWLKAWRYHATGTRPGGTTGIRWRDVEDVPTLFVAPRD